MREVLADPIRKDGTDALQRLCVEDPQTGRQAAFPSCTRSACSVLVRPTAQALCSAPWRQTWHVCSSSSHTLLHKYPLHVLTASTMPVMCSGLNQMQSYQRQLACCRC